MLNLRTILSGFQSAIQLIFKLAHDSLYSPKYTFVQLLLVVGCVTLYRSLLSRIFSLPICTEYTLDFCNKNRHRGIVM